jgi:hypothetical protein
MNTANWPAAVAFMGFFLVLLGGVNIFAAWACKNVVPLLFGERVRTITDDPQVSEFYAGRSRAGWAATLLGFSLVIAASAMVNFK